MAAGSILPTDPERLLYWRGTMIIFQIVSNISWICWALLFHHIHGIQRCPIPRHNDLSIAWIHIVAFMLWRVWDFISDCTERKSMVIQVLASWE
jgi:hypothetical protein